jgi:hypothetical protein
MQMQRKKLIPPGVFFFYKEILFLREGNKAFCCTRIDKVWTKVMRNLLRKRMNVI